MKLGVISGRTKTNLKLSTKLDAKTIILQKDLVTFVLDANRT